MQHYEMTVLGRTEPDLAAVTGLISGVGGTLTSEQQLGQRRLTYPIRKEAAAFFGVYQFEADPKKIIELNKKMLANEGLLRHLVIAGGIRQPSAAAVRKLSAKDLEVPESLTQGMAELAKTAAATQDVAATAETLGEAAGAAPEKPAKKVAKTAPAKETGAEELTAKERQKKLDEKLKSILGE